MIQSILDSDLYKFSQQQAVARLFPKAMARYCFVNRGQTKFPIGFLVLKFPIILVKILEIRKPLNSVNKFWK